MKILTDTDYLLLDDLYLALQLVKLCIHPYDLYIKSFVRFFYRILRI